MKWVMPLLLLLPMGACMSGGGYMSAAVVYTEPPIAEYEVPVDRVVIVSREALVARGYIVYHVDYDGPNRIIWARHGDDEVVRVFVTPRGQRVAVRSVSEVRDHGRHKGWVRHDAPRSVMGDIDERLHRH